MFWAGQMAGIASGTAGYAVDAADFDGTNDYMLRGAAWTGAADANSGIFSCWFRLDGGDAANRTFLYAAAGTQIYIDTSNKLQFAFGGAVSFNMASVSALTAGAPWRHALASWNRGSATPQLYIDDVSDVTIAANGTGPFTYTQANWGVGADTAGPGGSKFNGCFAEFYLALGQYLDFSTSANRAKFRSGGKPVNLGGDGSVPTGTAPTAYFSILNGGAAADFATNRGTGGNMTITGTLDIASSSPSD